MLEKATRRPWAAASGDRQACAAGDPGGRASPTRRQKLGRWKAAVADEPA